MVENIVQTRITNMLASRDRLLLLTFTKQSWKKSRRRDAPIRVSLAMAEWTVDFTVSKTFGHDLE